MILSSRIISKLTALLAVAFLGLNSGFAQQAAGEQIKTLWLSNQIPQLNTYLSSMASLPQDNVSTIVDTAFYDFIFLGKIELAKQKLERIHADVESRPGLYEVEFNTFLSMVIKDLNDEMRIQTNNDQNENDWQQNANPQAVRNATGTNLFPFLQLVIIAPTFTVPTQ